MRQRAVYALALLLAVIGGRISCDNRTKWYSGLRSILKNCPAEISNNSRQEELVETFRRCVQQRALAALDSLLDDDVIPVFDGVELIRFRDNSTVIEEYEESGGDSHDETNDGTGWSEIVLNRLMRVLRTHVFKIDVDRFVGPFNGSVSTEGNAVEGRRRRHRRRHHHVMPFMMMGLLLMGSILIPMGFQFLAVLGGKALILAKMALILSSIQGLKKIATSGVNYGLYHAPVAAEGWHERSHQESPSHFDPPYPHLHP